MQHSLAKMYGKPNDYRICDSCGTANWYENEGCVDGCVDSNLLDDEQGVIAFIENDYRYWKDSGLTEDEADEIRIDV